MSLEFQPRTRGGPGSASGRSSCSRSTGGRTSFAVGRSAFYSGRWQGERQSYDTRLSCQHSVTSAPPTYRHNLAIPRHAALPRRALGHLPPDPGPGRPGPEGRARHAHPLISGPSENRRHRRARSARQGHRGQARLPLRAPPHARRPAVTPSSTPSRPRDCRRGQRPRPSRSYNLNRDEIVLPERVQFPSANHYYQTALHELGHSTGHPERMNRATLTEGMSEGFGSPAYAKEELRAEISAMMTGERVGVGHDPRRGSSPR